MTLALCMLSTKGTNLWWSLGAVMVQAALSADDHCCQLCSLKLPCRLSAIPAN